MNPANGTSANALFVLAVMKMLAANTSQKPNETFRAILNFAFKASPMVM